MTDARQMWPNQKLEPLSDPIWRNRPMNSVRLATIIANRTPPGFWAEIAADAALAPLFPGRGR